MVCVSHAPTFPVASRRLFWKATWGSCWRFLSGGGGGWGPCGDTMQTDTDPHPALPAKARGDTIQIESPNWGLALCFWNYKLRPRSCVHLCMHACMPSFCKYVWDLLFSGVSARRFKNRAGKICSVFASNGLQHTNATRIKIELVHSFFFFLSLSHYETIQTIAIGDEISL